jgi:putative ABC transport system permease protein
MSRYSVIAKFALKNIMVNWRHSLATMLAITIGFAAASVFDGFIFDIRRQTEEYYVYKNMFGHLQLQKRGARLHHFEDPWLYTINKQEQELVQKFLNTDPRVAATNRYFVSNGYLSNGTTSSIFIGSGYDVVAGAKIRGEKWAWDTIAGKPLNLAGDDSIAIGIELAKKLDCEILGEIKTSTPMEAKDVPLGCTNPVLQLSVTTEYSQVNASRVKAVGVVDFQLREANERFILMPLKLAQQLYDTDRITRMSILLKDKSFVDGFLADFQKFIDDNQADLEVFSWFEHQAATIARGGLEILGVFKVLFLTIVAVIASMSVANTMMKSVNERTKEIGTFRSIGFRRNDIVLLFSCEGLVIGVFSCLAGFAATLVLAVFINQLGLSFKAGILSTPLNLHITLALSTWVSSFLVLSAIAFISSWLVSRRIAHLVIADTLRN